MTAAKKISVPLSDLINSLSGVQNIRQTPVGEIILALGPDFKATVQNLLTTYSPQEANRLVGILLEFYTKLGIHLESPSLLTHFKSPHLHLVGWDKTHRKIIPLKLDRDLSSGTSASGEIDVLFHRGDANEPIALSSKADKTRFEKSSLTQPIAWAQLEMDRMNTLKTAYPKATLSAVVVDKTNLAKRQAGGLTINDPKAFEYLLDQTALQGTVREIYQWVVNHNLKTSQDFWQALNYQGKTLITKYHQEVGSDSAIKYYNKGGKEFLIFHHPRSGKIVLTLEIVRKMNLSKVLVLTNQPVLNQEWTNNVNKFSLYHNFQVIDLCAGDEVPDNFDPNKTYIFLGSLQGAKSHLRRSLEHLVYNQIQDLKFDLLVSDEFHNAFSTNKTKKLLKKIKRNHDLCLTGTAEKVINQFKKDQIHRWDLEDAHKFLNDPTVSEEEKESYRHYPQLKYIRWSPIKGLISSLEKFYSPHEGLSMQKIHAVKDKKTLSFIHPQEVSKLWHYFLGNKSSILSANMTKEAQIALLKGDPTKSKFPLIKAEQDLGYAPRINLIYFDTVEIQMAVNNLLLSSEFKPFLDSQGLKVVYTNSKINNNPEKLRSFVQGLDNSKDRYLVLAVDQLKEGITLDRADTVTHMNDQRSSTQYRQKSYRAGSPDLTVDKKLGLVFDFNPTRALLMDLEFLRTDPLYKGKSLHQAFREFYSLLPIEWGEEFLENGEINIDQIVRQALASSLFYNGFTGGFKFQKDVSEISKVTINQLQSLNLQGSSRTPNTILVDAVMNKGKIGKKEPLSKKIETSDLSEYELIQKAQHLLNCIPWLVILSKGLGTKINSVEEMEQFYSQKPTNSKTFGIVNFNHLFQEVIFGSLNLKWSVNTYVKIITSLKEVNSLNEEISRLNIDLDGVSNSDLSRLLDMDSPVHKNILGQVKTPDSVCNLLITSIAPQKLQDPQSKFKDRYCGSGNILFHLKNSLMDSLKTKIPNPSQREKHILENMIFGQDLLLKNIILAKLRLDPQGQYKLNLQVKDSLAHAHESPNTILIQNPATEKIEKKQWDRLKTQSEIKINRIDAYEIEKFLNQENLTEGHFVLPQWLLNGSKYKSLREKINQYHITKIHLFSSKMFPKIDCEFLLISINKTLKTPNSKTTIISDKRTLVQNQNYITDPAFPNWVLFRDSKFDETLKERILGVFDVIRDRKITKAIISSTPTNIRLLTPEETPGNLTILPEGEGSKYLAPQHLSSVPVSQFLNQENVFLAPNLTAKTRMVRMPLNTLATGSFGFLTLKDEFTALQLDNESLLYFETSAFREFYAQALNYSTMSLNLDSGIIYWWGLARSLLAPE